MPLDILIHGAMHGSWCWDRVRPLLEARGHTVLTPTLAGQGERHAELNSSIGTSTHMVEIAALLRERQDPRAHLVLHSYEWRPLIDDEPSVAPNIYTRRGVFQIKTSRMRLGIDVDPVHRGQQDRVYANDTWLVTENLPSPAPRKSATIQRHARCPLDP
jgi:hypothetical protein